MAMKSVLDTFSGLRINSPKRQKIAGVRIIKHIVKEQGLNEDACREFELAVKRIIRGLGAPSSTSRTGYFTVFAALPETFQSEVFTLDMCIQIIEKELEVYRKEDLADVCKGQILAYGALVSSNKISEATDAQLEMILEKILSVRNKKSYLKLGAHVVLVELLKSINEDTMVKCMWKKLYEQVILPDKQLKPLPFYHLLLVLSKQFPNFVDAAVLESIIGAPAVFHDNTIENITSSMLNIEKNKLVNSPMYREMLDCIASKTDWMKIFWNEVSVPTTVYQSESKIKMELEIFSYLVKELKNKNKIRHLLNDQFIMIFTSKYCDHGEENHSAPINALIEVTKDANLLSSKTQRFIVERLAFYPGNLGFAFGPGKKLINSLVNNFDLSNVKHFGNLFHDILSDKKYEIIGATDIAIVDRPWKDSHKRKACIALSRLLNHPAVDQVIDWKVNILKKIIDLAFFTRKPTLNLEQAAKCCFFSALDINVRSLRDQKELFNKMVFYINEKLVDTSICQIAITDKFMRAWKDIIDALRQINLVEKSEDTSELSKTVFEVLFYLLAFMLIRDAESTIPIITELRMTYNELYSTDKGNKEEKHGGEQQSDELHWTDVLIELILSMLSSESHLQRNVISKIFVYLCPYLTSRNINQILKVLNPNENKVISTETDSDTDDNDSDSDTNESDVEMSSDTDSGEDDKPAVEEDDKDLELLRANVHEALSTIKDTKTISVDEMSEEEGRRLDESLSAAFRKMKQQSKKTQEAEEKQLNLFRARVLDLLEKYIKMNPELESVLDILVTLLMLLEHLINNGSDIELQNRIKTFLKKFSSIKKFSMKAKLDSIQLIKLLEKLIDKDEKTTVVYINMKEEIVECCTFILKLSLKDNKCFQKMRPYVLEIYLDSLKEFLTVKSSIIPVDLFTKAMSLPWDGAFSLAEMIINCISNKEVRRYQLKNCLFLLSRFFANGRLLTSETKEAKKEVLKKIVRGLIDNIDAFQNQPLKIRKMYISVAQAIRRHELLLSSGINRTIVSLKKEILKKQPEAADGPVKGNQDSQVVQKKSTDQPLKSKSQVKKRKYQEALKEKKLSKLRRIQNSSEGLEQGLFVFDNNATATQAAFICGEIVKSDEEDN